MEERIRGGILIVCQCYRIDAICVTEWKETRATSVGSAIWFEAPNTNMQKSYIGLSFELVPAKTIFT